MRRSTPLALRLFAIPLCMAAFGLECPQDPNNNNNNDNNNNSNTSVDRLFVVNNNYSVSSFAADAQNDATPLTELPLGATTDIFQARAIMVTSGNVLLVGRQNGGITAHDGALTATGETPADRVIDGTDTLLDSPIAFAYDAANDRLYVGNINASDGILVFDNVSDDAFDGEVIPDRKFNPTDRAPTDNSPMTIDALWLDNDGVLYVSDTSGLNVNSSRILIYKNPESAENGVDPDAVLESNDWGGIQDLAVDPDGNLYVVDGNDYVVRIDSASANAGELTVNADVTITVPGSGVALDGIVISSDGVCFLADRGNHEIHAYVGIAELSGTPTPNRTITGSNTGLFSPRQLWLVEAAD